MRTIRLLAVTACIAGVTACAPGLERRSGNAAPAGSPADSASASASTGSPGSAGATAPAPTGTSTPSQPRSTATPRGQSGDIRTTDWRNVSIQFLAFCGESDRVVDFRNGSNGNDVPCLILPDGAQPVYAHFMVEEPANRPATEDALVLVQLGNPGGARRQALVPVGISSDGSSRIAFPIIEGDQPSPSGDRVMTFSSYRIEQGAVIATVRNLDGGTEIRRYRKDGMYGPWVRA